MNGCISALALLHGLLQAASLAATCLLRQAPNDSGRPCLAALRRLWGEHGRPNRQHRILAGLLAAFVQALAMMFKRDHSPEALAVFLEAEAAIVVFLIGIPLLASEAWLDRYPLLYNFACRLAFVNAGNNQEHSVNHTLQAEPPNGRLWLLKSTWQLFLGTKCSALLGLAVIAPLPLLPHLLLAVAD
ncbi:delta(8)-fatty-acid desaturase 2-like [Chlorella sorokiniana]|uniref:Delta(8)-fatty-acid desaturase 2-like n=1 Tax=Chlorella sorokiniana TaxID=3076 RepID=A0A2P6TPP3_CHLSO|nr:delta(8)-fatty-acid desaturase 2-like [Chlorella sorokiniana]|eukprot:PRW56005.1 delta(8)-fatty-acid desaturase 2-like [Chlorella sorokiniana]